MNGRYQFVGATIRNYRSIGSLTLKVEEDGILVLCGPNNVGKTNVLRALDLFFSLDPTLFDDKRDLPHHVYDGSRGEGAKTTVAGEFREQSNGRKITIRASFRRDEDLGNIMELKGVANRKSISEEEAISIVKSFRFLFIEASNINLPQLVAHVFADEILPDLDTVKRRGQSSTLKILKEFFDAANKTVVSIEHALTANLDSLIGKVPGFDNKGWRAKVVFPEFETLREAISGQVSFTLLDSNARSLESKGSGIQRMVLLAVMKYVADTSVQSCIWAIDEPEAFLQPGLQRAVFEELRRLSVHMPILMTTHSPHFIDISDVRKTHLLSSTEEPKTYKRRPGKVFLQVDTVLDQRTGTQKLQAIREHFGMKKNDSWHVLPVNLLVEGEEDKAYLTALADSFGIALPNFFVAGGADKIPGFLEFMAEFCSDLTSKPHVTCLLDHDDKGKQLYDKLKSKENDGRLPYCLSRMYVLRADGHSHARLSYEIEDWMYPDLLFRAAGAFLKKKGYDKPTETQWRLRTTAAYQDQCILAFITEVVKMRNPSQPTLYFESLPIKIWLCNEVCNIIRGLSEPELMALDATYPSTRNLLNQLALT